MSGEGSGIPLLSDVTTTYDVTTPMMNMSGGGMSGNMSGGHHMSGNPEHSGHPSYFNLGNFEFVILIRQLRITNYQGFVCFLNHFNLNLTILFKI